MQSLTEVQIVIAITLLLLAITSFVVIFIVVYQNKYHKHLKEKEILKQELLKTELEIQESTMQSISQEIHDNIGQVLSLCKLHLTNMALDETNHVHDKIITTKDLLSKAIVDLRDLSKTLNKEYIAHESLIDLMQKKLIEIKRAELHHTHFRMQGLEVSVDPGKQLILFRMVQESLQNILKHADAKNISIHVNYEVGHMQISIHDDGRGFDATGYVKGNGIYNMMYKAKLIGALYKISSEPLKGTQVEISLPLY